MIGQDSLIRGALGHARYSRGVASTYLVGFSVADTGIGIAPEDIDTAITSLSQTGDPFTREVQGAGLGLPLSKRLVELHGGTLELESEVGVGTIALVRFPPERTIQPS